ncbi:MAG: alkane 1-monooxygenase [Pseudomonadota bacterium]
MTANGRLSVSPNRSVNGSPGAVDVPESDNTGAVFKTRGGVKKYLWLFSLVGAAIAPLTVFLYNVSGGNTFATLFPLFYIYAFVPMLDLAFGEDPFNPSAEEIEAMEADPFYRRLLHVSVPLFYASFFVVVWFVGTNALPWWSLAALAWGFGSMHGDVLTIGHELGHKSNRTDRTLAQIINGLIGYGHFCIEHNRGHHVWVSTPEDPASARMGESIYRFAARELPGAFRRGWAHETERLQRKGLSKWSLRNEILQSYALTLVVSIVVVALFGVKTIPFMVAHHLVGWYALTQANYVEHYGLKREKLPTGKYEPVAPRHSWNTNHIVSNLLLFQLQRHSDHHANAQRPYQVLRNFPDLPRLPSGYPGCFAMAAVPPVWFRVMDPKVIDWAGGDLEKVNVAPHARERLARTYGAPDLAATPAE